MLHGEKIKLFGEKKGFKHLKNYIKIPIIKLDMIKNVSDVLIK